MSTSHVPEWLLERLVAGELDADQAAALRARLEHAGELHRLEAIEKSNVEILSALPPSQVVPEIQRRLDRVERRQKSVRLRWSVGFATACAAGLAIFLAAKEDPGRPPFSASTSTEETIGIKYPGDRVPPKLLVYRRTTNGNERLGQEHLLRAGDALQIRYLAAKFKYGVIASIDARGAITLHMPERPGSATPLAQEGEIALPHSFELDDSPGFERFVFVAADEPFPTSIATDMLAKKTAAPTNFHADAVTFKKATP